MSSRLHRSCRYRLACDIDADGRLLRPDNGAVVAPAAVASAVRPIRQERSCTGAVVHDVPSREDGSGSQDAQRLLPRRARCWGLCCGGPVGRAADDSSLEALARRSGARTELSIHLTLPSSLLLVLHSFILLRAK